MGRAEIEREIASESAPQYYIAPDGTPIDRPVYRVRRWRTFMRRTEFVLLKAAVNSGIPPQGSVPAILHGAQRDFILDALLTFMRIEQLVCFKPGAEIETCLSPHIGLEPLNRAAVMKCQESSVLIPIMTSIMNYLVYGHPLHQPGRAYPDGRLPSLVAPLQVILRGRGRQAAKLLRPIRGLLGNRRLNYRDYPIAILN
jgi:hypothetical protein